MNRDERFAQHVCVLNDAHALFMAKNIDYGDSFAELGVIGVIVRLRDKLSRAISIERNGITLVHDERLYETCIDIVNYAAMIIMLRNENDKGSVNDDR